MPHSPTQRSQNYRSSRHTSTPSHKHFTQHGNAHRHNSRSSVAARDAKSMLLGLPSESLTHITSYLDPTSLFAISRLNRRLHQHIEDDNTWRRAYVYQFLGISPEGDIHDGGSLDGTPGKALMLRREETSWKREFVLRWNLRRRWERPKPSTISYSPMQSAISSIHLMPSLSLSPTAPPALLTSYLQYGIVARSYPLTGKVLRGYLDASGTLNGLGIGNPNAEFSPDLTQCALSAEGGTARIVWGFRSGTVAVTNAHKAMEISRPAAARWICCAPGDAHAGAVEHAAWVNGGSNNGGGFFVTGGIDGRVKVWDAKGVLCLWTSQVEPGQVLKDSCVKVAADSHGIVAAVFKSGTVSVWTGLGNLFTEDPKETVSSGTLQARILPLPIPSMANPYGDAQRKVSVFHLHLESPTAVSLLTAYEGEPYFYRSSVDIPTGAIERVAFGGASMGAITVIHPVFSEKVGDYGFIVAGDSFGYVRIFPWDGHPTPPDAGRSLPTGAPTASVQPARQFEAHSVGAVTAIAWTSSVIVTGSSSGSIKAFDSLTLALLHDFTSPSARPVVGEEVKQIIVERDFFAASIANRVVAWRGEPGVRTDHHSNAKGKRIARMPNGIAKWHQQVEMYRDIAESQLELEHEQAHVRSVFGRERDQQTALQNLGLSEVEAVEYILMLSRDDEERRRQQTAQLTADDGVFSGSFDEDLQTPAAASSDSSDRAYANMFTFNGRTYPRPYHSPSSSRIHVSPRLRPEPMEAGSSSPGSQFSLSSSLSSSRSGSSVQLPLRDDPSHFPSMSSTPTRRSISGSPESVRSAWSTPLRMTRSEGPPSPRMNGSLVSSPAARNSGVSLLSQRLAQTHVNEDQAAVAESLGSSEDEDLRFAIELSLAEARSRGEDV